MLERGENWSLEYDDGVVIGRFERGMPLSAFEEEAYPAFERILGEHETDIVATADIVRLEDALGQDVLDIWEQAARESSQLPNYERAALVADGILKYGLKGQLRVPDAEIETFEDPERAIHWARTGEQ
ncbi:hypothetical protein RYH80_14835 [Halobaculum sp. MBLA0147]|uniref:hypothetical protein n=1 Tax=Halobaculum sp. MBLA0147 TaxID=3079934 RepID=UPI003524D77D